MTRGKRVTVDINNHRGCFKARIEKNLPNGSAWVGISLLLVAACHTSVTCQIYADIMSRVYSLVTMFILSTGLPVAQLIPPQILSQDNTTNRYEQTLSYIAAHFKCSTLQLWLQSDHLVNGCSDLIDVALIQSSNRSSTGAYQVDAVLLL